MGCNRSVAINRDYSWWTYSNGYFIISSQFSLIHCITSFMPSDSSTLGCQKSSSFALEQSKSIIGSWSTRSPVTSVDASKLRFIFWQINFTKSLISIVSPPEKWYASPVLPPKITRWIPLQTSNMWIKLLCALPPPWSGIFMPFFKKITVLEMILYNCWWMPYTLTDLIKETGNSNFLTIAIRNKSPATLETA